MGNMRSFPHLPANQHPTAITIVATMKIQPIGSPKIITEWNAPMKGAKAMRYQRKVKPDTLSIITM